jgi:hypothetical protein
MKEQIEAARAALWAYIQGGNRANRRKAVQAFKLVNKAALVFGCDRLTNERPASNAQEVKYPGAGQATPLPPAEGEGSTVIASNVEAQDQPGPEKVRRGRKPKDA